jgi:hypothetical protein
VAQGKHGRQCERRAQAERVHPWHELAACPERAAVADQAGGPAKMCPPGVACSACVWIVDRGSSDVAGEAAVPASAAQLSDGVALSVSRRAAAWARPRRAARFMRMRTHIFAVA